MVDNTTNAAGPTVATDDIGGIHYPRVKIGIGADGTAVDWSATNPAPIIAMDAAVGPTTITVTDTAGGGAPAGAGALISTPPTASSFVPIQCPGGDSAWNVMVTGLTTGTLYFEGSIDSTNGSNGNWTAVNGRQTGVVNTVLNNNASANGFYRGNTSGLAWFRVRSAGALTGTPAIMIRVTDGPGSVFLNASIPAGTNSIGTTMGPTLTKATQGATGYSTQDLKDAGRVLYSTSTVIAGVTAVITTEAMLSMVPVRDGVAAAAATSFGVTTGKRWRIQKIILSGNTTAAAVLSARISLRLQPAAAATTASPKIGTASLNGPAAVALTGDHAEIILPDGFEISGTQQIGLSQLAAAITGTLHASIIGYEY